MSDRLVSVIIPFLNGERFLQDAIESVFAQTHKNWELLLVDDGSTDNSSRIAREYSERHAAKIQYLEHSGHENRGACASRNLGIRSARAQYIAPLDADDVWLPNKLEQQVAIMESYPTAAMVCGAPRLWYSWTGDPANSGRDSLLEIGIKGSQVIDPPLLLRLSLESKVPTASPSDVLLRKDVVEQIGGFEEEFRGAYQLFEDQAFFAKITLRFHVYVAAECWTLYRQHSNSCVSVVNAAGQKASVALYYFDWLAQYLAAFKVQDRSLLLALKAKRRRYRHPILNRLLVHSHGYVQKIKQLRTRKAD